MLPQAVLEAARRRVALETADRRELVRREFSEITAKLSARGMLMSSELVRLTRELVAREYRIRAQLAWQAWAAALATQAAVPLADLRETLVAEITRCLEADSQDVEGVYQEAVRIASAAAQNPQQVLLTLRTEAIERAASAIDYAILEATARQPANAGEVTFHFHGPVGAVQTGAASTASVVQTIGPTEREAILGALAAVEAEALGALADQERAQVIEVVADVRAEAKKDKPNLIRLRGGLSAIATTIQTAAAAPGAYSLLKGALAFFGVLLP